MRELSMHKAILLSKQMKLVFAALLAAAMVAGCGKAKIFTEIDYSFDNIEDIFPGKFKSENVSLRAAQPSYYKRLQASDYRAGIYGKLVSLEVWEHESDAMAKNNYGRVVAREKADRQSSLRVTESGEKRPGFNSMSESKTSESRFDYTDHDGMAGMVWTNKSFLFHVTALNEDVLRDFLTQAGLAKLQ